MMETKTALLKETARQLRLTGLSANMDELMLKAQKENISYIDFTFGLLNAEIDYRNAKNMTKYLKIAATSKT